MKTETKISFFSVAISIMAILVSGYTWYIDHNLNERIFELEKHTQDYQENETNAPPDAKLTQEFDNSFNGELKILNKFYFEKYNKRKFTIKDYYRNITLNGKEISGGSGCGGFELRFYIQGINESDSYVCEFILPINSNEFFGMTVKEIDINHILIIKDNYNNKLYRGTAGGAINNSCYRCPENFSSMFNPQTFIWTEVK